jgi:hypothetical protein
MQSQKKKEPLKSKQDDVVLTVHCSNISLDELLNHFEKRKLNHGKNRC